MVEARATAHTRLLSNALAVIGYEYNRGKDIKEAIKEASQLLEGLADEGIDKPLTVSEAALKIVGDLDIGTPLEDAVTKAKRLLPGFQGAYVDTDEGKGAPNLVINFYFGTETDDIYPATNTMFDEWDNAEAAVLEDLVVLRYHFITAKDA